MSFNGLFSARIGRRYTLLAFALLFSVGAVRPFSILAISQPDCNDLKILTTVAESPSNGLALIYAGRVISGVGIGGISAVAPAFVSECCPKEVRGRITGLFQIMVAIGVMLSYFINCASIIYLPCLLLLIFPDGIGINIHNSVNVWRIPFGFQLVPAGIMTFGLLTIKVCLQ